MKKRVGSIYGKPIVIGDKNLKTPNEIHKDELKGGGGDIDSTKYYQLNKKIDVSGDINGITIIYAIVPFIATLIKSRDVPGLGGNSGFIGVPGSINAFKNIIDASIASDPEGFAIVPTYFGTIIPNTEKDSHSVVDDRHYVGEDFKEGLYAFYYFLAKNVPEFNIISSKEDFFRYYDEFISTYCVEVTKEQFFDFNYTLIEE